MKLHSQQQQVIYQTIVAYAQASQAAVQITAVESGLSFIKLMETTRLAHSQIANYFNIHFTTM